MPTHHKEHIHADISARLKRANGHLLKIISMIDDNRPCLDIAQQMQAVEKALRSAKTAMIHDHIDHCLRATLNKKEDSRDAVAEFKEVTKYL